MEAIDILDPLFETVERHQPGALRAVLQRAWAGMSAGERIEWLRGDAVTDVLGEKDQGRLVAEVCRRLESMEKDVTARGYTVREGENGFFWVTDEDSSREFPFREDAVESAWRHLQGRI